jgi:hypothetical protein
MCNREISADRLDEECTPGCFCTLAREAGFFGPQDGPTPISYRLARASRSGSYSAVITRTGGACIPPSRAQPAPVQIARHGFKVPQARSKSFPNAAEIGQKTEFLTVNGGFGPSSNVVSTGRLKP